MAASERTVKQIVEVFSRHLPSAEAVRELVLDLRRSVEGNRSVEETLDRLEELTR